MPEMFPSVSCQMPENSPKRHYVKISETCRITRRTPYFSAFTGNVFSAGVLPLFPACASQFFHGSVGSAASGGIALRAWRRLRDVPRKLAISRMPEIAFDREMPHFLFQC
jgi:hypothetical protein